MAYHLIMDVMTPTQRLKAMRSNRGRTGPERALAKALWSKGFRYYTCDGYRSRTGIRLVGNPDIIFPTKRVVIFVDGCFWHGCQRCHDFAHDCNTYWREKIERNVARDQRYTRKLRRAGWKVIRVREHDIVAKPKLSPVVARLAQMLTSVL
jgi:DNA mismatch endonuclease (patch repair protein)